MDELNTNTIKTAYRFDSNGYFLGTDSVMEDSEGNLLLPSDDTMLEPELKEGYWSKFDKAGNKWVEEKIPATCQEVIDAGLSVVSNSSEPHDRELIDLFARLVEAEKDVYQLHTESGTLVQTIEKIPAPTDEDIGQQHYCAFASRRDIYQYVHSHDEVLQRYGDRMVMCERMPELFSAAMGQQMYTVRLESMEEVNEFVEFVHLKK